MCLCVITINTATNAKFGMSFLNLLCLFADRYAGEMSLSLFQPSALIAASG